MRIKKFTFLLGSYFIYGYNPLIKKKNVFSYLEEDTPVIGTLSLSFRNMTIIKNILSAIHRTCH